MDSWLGAGSRYALVGLDWVGVWLYIATRKKKEWGVVPFEGGAAGVVLVGPGGNSLAAS